jgi:L-ascorbate metabolism protein UlaG (beta-lactamase superfamily)
MDCQITHISTACVLLEIPAANPSIRILTDPVFDTGCHKYGFGPGIKATRFRGPSLDPEDLPEVDAVLLSHAQHLDNLDESGKAFLPKAKRVITSAGGRKKLHCDAVGLRVWEQTTICARGAPLITVTATPARHGIAWHVIGFVLQWEGQQFGALYISGDTIHFKGVEEIAGRFRIGTGILHLGGVHFSPRIPKCLRFTFHSEDAVKTAKQMNLRQIIPVHYEQRVWTHFKESVSSYHTAFQEAGLHEQVIWLPKGRPVRLKV